MLTNFDKALAGQAGNPKRSYIVGGFHRSELVVGAIDKPGEMVARLCGYAVVVDEDMMAHAQLGDDNLLFAGKTGSVLEVDADHLVLVSSKQLLHGVDVVLHHGQVDDVHHRGIRLPCMGLDFMPPNSIGAPLDILSVWVFMGVLVVLWGEIERLKRRRL